MIFEQLINHCKLKGCKEARQLKILKSFSPQFLSHLDVFESDSSYN